MLPYQTADLQALRYAARLHRRTHAIQCSGQTGTWSECLYSNRADFTALASSASEGSLLAGLNLQPTFYPSFWEGTRAFGRSFALIADGVFSTTGTPTLIFQARLSTTAGSSTLSGGSIGVSAAITTINNSSNAYWRLVLEMNCNTPGQGTGNTTLSGAGLVTSPAGFASPFAYALEPTTPPTATWTQTLDSSLSQYLNLSCTWSASSSSNTITCKKLLVLGLN